MKWNKTVKNTKKADPRYFLNETSVKVGDMVKSRSEDWEGTAKVVDVNRDTSPAMLTVSLPSEDNTFQTTLDDAEVVSGN